MEDKNRKDRIVRGTAADGMVRIFAITARNMVRKAQKTHSLTPAPTIALGRSLMAGSIMGSMMKSETDVMTMIVEGDGELGKITVTADSKARVKGYVGNPYAGASVSEDGKLDVGGCVGRNGTLTVIRDMGLKEPYVGQTDLISGEIAEDLTVYFASSEQVPSSVALGVLLGKDMSVKQAGGFILQLMPGASEEVISYLEKKLTEVTDISQIFDEGVTPEQLIEYILAPYNPEILDTIEPALYCNCSKNRFSKGLATLSAKDLKEIIADGKPIEVNCQFCGKHYYFGIDELNEMLTARRMAAAEKLKRMQVIGIPNPESDKNE